MCRRREYISLILLAVILLQATVVLAAGGNKNGAPESRPTAAHPVGRLSPDAPQPRIVIKDFECVVDDPVIPGERVVLTTVGVEHEEDGDIIFHPSVSVAVDKTFPETAEGQWLALWTLGEKSPGFLSRLRAIIPGFRASKRVREKELSQLEDELENFDEAWAEGEMTVPEPHIDATHLHRRSTTKLILNGITRGLDLANVFYPAQLMFRNFLIHRQDYQEREFQHSYVGLTWYNDLSSTTPEEESLSADAVQDIKFRLLANRKALGRWVDRRMRNEFVHQFENEVRDHLWGTSCTLAGAANEYYLRYEELQRITESGVSLALGGILYYDPTIAPAPDQVKWSLANPFDLTYNPFTDPAVQRAAQESPGTKVPLALYVYQSNHALKPIIVIDFFRPDNPRTRESARYWRKLANEAIAASDIGLLYTTLNRVVNFSANRKTSTWFSDKGPALGVEELRLSLQGHLYFESEVADSLLDRIDRRIVNPLVQPGRLQQRRADLHYQALQADGGKAVLRRARQVREKLIRQVANNGKSPLTPDDYAAYRRSLRLQPYLRRLEVLLSDQFAGSIYNERLIEALQGVAAEADGHSQEAIDVLMRLHGRLTKQFRAREQAGRSIDWELNSLIARTDATLERLYQTSGYTLAKLQNDIAELVHQQAQEEAHAEAKWQKWHAEQFSKQLDEQIKFLEGFIKSGGNLTKFSPWYVARALEFLRQVPEAISVNPSVADTYREKESRIRHLLDQSAQKLEGYRPPVEAAWLEEGRFDCLHTVREIQSVLMALRPELPSIPETGIVRLDADGAAWQPR